MRLPGVVSVGLHALGRRIWGGAASPRSVWVSCLARRLRSPLSAILTAPAQSLCQSGSTKIPRHHCCCKPQEVGAASAQFSNPYTKVLKSQLERYIVEQLGASYLANRAAQTDWRKINKEIAELKKRIKELQVRKDEIEKSASR
jgi:hypothetical protein